MRKMLYYGRMNQEELNSEAPDKRTREEALESIRKLRVPLPPGFKFDREEAHQREGFGDLTHGKVIEGMRIEDPFRSVND
jgi:hypothetical protein